MLRITRKKITFIQILVVNLLVLISFSLFCFQEKTLSKNYDKSKEQQTTKIN